MQLMLQLLDTSAQAADASDSTASVASQALEDQLQQETGWTAQDEIRHALQLIVADMQPRQQAARLASSAAQVCTALP